MAFYKFALELIYDIKIRTVKVLPRSMQDLYKEVSACLGLSGIIVKYMDEEGDLITISTDQELLESYQIVSDLDLSVFKLLIEPGTNFQSNDSDIDLDEDYVCTVKTMLRTEMENSIGYDKTHEPTWEGVTCDGCQELPITGIRFKCTVCDNFDYCEFCEMTMQHPHPFLKLTTLEHNNCMIQVTLNNKKNIKRGMVVKRPKMKFVQHVSYVEGEKVKPGQVMEKIWKLKNIGNDEWPAGCKVEFAKGDLVGIGYEIGTVPSGACIDAIASINIPDSEGRYTGVWKLVTPDGVSFGDKLYVVVQSLSNEEIPEQQISYFLELGFNKDIAIRALKMYPNDIQAAIKYLVNN